MGEARTALSEAALRHLAAIAELRASHGYARVSDVARRLGITRGSASITLKTLKKKGLVEEDGNRFLLLSRRGGHVTEAIRSKERLAARLLHMLAPLPSGTVHDDAFGLGYALSDEMARHLLRFLDLLGSDNERALAFRRAWTEARTNGRPREAIALA